MLPDPDDEFAPDVPGWLSGFVGDELRPFLLKHEQAALAGLRAWLIHIAGQLADKRAWQASGSEFFAGLASLPKRRRHRPDCPVEGCVWTHGMAITTKRGQVGRLWVTGWMPAAMANTDEPPLHLPIPPPANRDPLPAECWAAILAVHDWSWAAEQRIVQDEELTNSVFAFLLAGVGDLSEDTLPRLRRMMAVAGKPTPVVRSPAPAVPVATGVPGDSVPPPALSDGPCDPFSFHWNGVRREFVPSERRYYHFLVAVWPAFQRRQSILCDDVNDRLAASHRTRVTWDTLKNYASGLLKILRGWWPDFPAELKKDGDFLRWTDTTQSGVTPKCGDDDPGDDSAVPQ